MKPPKPKRRMVKDVVAAFTSVVDQRVIDTAKLRRESIRCQHATFGNPGVDLIRTGNMEAQFDRANAVLSFAIACGYIHPTPLFVDWKHVGNLTPDIVDALSASKAEYFHIGFGRRAHTNRPTQFELNVKVNFSLGKILPGLPVTQVELCSLNLGAGQWQPIKGSKVRYRYPATANVRLDGSPFFSVRIPEVIRPFLVAEFNVVWPEDWPSDQEVVDTTNDMITRFLEANNHRLTAVTPEIAKQSVDELDDAVIKQIAFGIRKVIPAVGKKKYFTPDEQDMISVIEQLPKTRPYLLDHPKVQKAIAASVAGELDERKD